MAEPFLGQVILVGFNFAPRGWALCDGQLLPISQNAALFSLLGTTYGGDGRTTFALPDLRGRAPIHQGQGSGLSARTIGSRLGVEEVTLTTNEMPAHTHSLNAFDGLANQQSPVRTVPATEPTGQTATYSTQPANSVMSPEAIGTTGGSQAHSNMQPSLTMNYCIALEGVFPPRN